MFEIAHDATPGRLRLRAESLRGRRDLTARLDGLAAARPGLLSAELRPLTGSVIIRFDAKALSAGEAQAAVESALRSDAGPDQSCPDQSCRDQSCRTDAAPPAEIVKPGPAVSQATGGSKPKSEPPPQARARAAAVIEEIDWHARTVDRIAAELRSDRDRGLSAGEAAARLKLHGRNRPPEHGRNSPLAMLANQFQGAPVIMLGVSALISIGTGGVADGVATLAVVVVNGVLGFVTEGQAERRIHALTDSSTQTARVVRDGREISIAASELAPGDVILLAAGRQAPVDARLIAARSLSVDESPLTGESVLVEKDPGASPPSDAPIGARPTMVFAGTIIAEGTGRAMVVETGARTHAATIQSLTAEPGRPQAPVEAELERLGSNLALASLAACGLFVGVGVFRGYALSAMLKDALALAVAAVPEGLPMVATSTLARGVGRMERKGILIRQINAVETLGALQTICLDKTGTLTQNRMEVVRAAAGLRETGLRAREDLAALAEVATLNNDGEVSETGVAATSPTESALLNFALSLGLDAPALRARRPRLDTVERAPGRPWMTTVHGGATPLTAVKGAPEAVLARCETVLEQGETRPLTPEDRNRILALNDQIASTPARVLSFASKEDGEATNDPQGLTWLGLVGMVDPIRPSAPGFIKAMHGAGLETVLITGDQAATAEATARSLDLSNGAPLKVVDGAALRGLDPTLLSSLARNAHVFARVSSQDKLAIVQALQATGRVVAMTGDGVNDGPALNAADVGVAMGESGADLARDVANVVIRDDELGTLAEAIGQGRSIYRNIRRSLEFLVTTNISEIIVSIIEALHGPGELETPMELLWINLATDVLPGLGLALADPDPDVMNRPPRAPDEPIIPEEDVRRMALDSSVIAGSALAAHFIGLAKYGPGPQTRGMTFLSLSLGQLLYTLVCQHRDPRRLRIDRLLENRTLDAALLVSSGLAVLPFFAPPLRRLLGVDPLSPADTAVSLAAAATPFASVLARRGLSFERIVKEDLS